MTMTWLQHLLIGPPDEDAPWLPFPIRHPTMMMMTTMPGPKAIPVIGILRLLRQQDKYDENDGNDAVAAFMLHHIRTAIDTILMIRSTMA
jgi:hypothetical protein